ncbi:MAG: glycosyltransferase [Anaerolineae bacterium]|nr:glycosyltransferase [Anaerolineae bacterium]
MHVLHLYKDYFPVLGGIENHIRALARAQAAHDHQVTVLVTSTHRRTHEEDDQGVRVIKAARLAAPASTPISLVMPLLVHRQRPDIIHLHFPYPWGELSALLCGPAAPWVMTYHSDIVRQRRLERAYRPILKRVLDRTARIIVTSPRYLETSPWLRAFAGKCRVVPLGVDLAVLQRVDAQQVEEIRRRFPGPLLLFVGRLRYYKGVDYLIQAMAEVPAATLLVVGEGPMRRPWEELARGSGAAERIRFLGEVPDPELPAYYHACDVFVLPASQRSEAFGTVLLEAMACGKPVITTELGTGTSWVNRHGETGLVVPPADPDALAGAIRTLLSNPDLRRRMGEAARRRVAEEFTLERMAAGVERIYAEVLEGRPPSG